MAQFGLLHLVFPQKGILSMSWAHLLHLSFSTRAYLPRMMQADHLHVFFLKKITSHGITGPASSELFCEFLLPMTWAHLPHLNFSPNKCFQWHALICFICFSLMNIISTGALISFISLSPKRIAFNFLLLTIRVLQF